MIETIHCSESNVLRTNAIRMNDECMAVVILKHYNNNMYYTILVDRIQISITILRYSLTW